MGKNESLAHYLSERRQSDNGDLEVSFHTIEAPYHIILRREG